MPKKTTGKGPGGSKKTTGKGPGGSKKTTGKGPGGSKKTTGKGPGGSKKTTGKGPGGSKKTTGAKGKSKGKGLLVKNRPRNTGGKGKGRRPPGNQRRPGGGLARNRPGTKGAIRDWSKGRDPVLRGLAGNRGRLTLNQRTYVNRQINSLRNLSRRTRWQNAQFQAFIDFRNQDLFFGRCDRFYGRLGVIFTGIGLVGNLLPPYYVGGVDFDDSSVVYLCPGIEPYYPAYECPGDVGINVVERCVCQVVPGSAEYDEGYIELAEEGDAEVIPPEVVRRRSPRQYVPPPQPGETPDDTAVEEEGGGIEEQEILNHKTRYLRLGNGSKKRVTFYIRYHARDEDGNFQWYPAEGEEPLVVNVGPDEVADSYDGKWHLHADRVYVWAETEDGQEWNAFKKKSLWLVPEVDDDGNHSYQAPALDTFVFSVTPKSLEIKKEGAAE